MKVIRNITVPTGNILIVQGENGPLECLSLGDYGKDVNVKCDAMGFAREPSPVRHTKLLPLEEKWVITISTQYGCSMGCRFCDVPKVGPGTNASVNDLLRQVNACMALHPEVKRVGRLNLHYARMGEPTFNPNVLFATYLLHGRFKTSGAYPAAQFHPVVSTMLPRTNRKLDAFLCEWMRYKNDVAGGDAGLQLSINSTDDTERRTMFRRSAVDIHEAADIMDNVLYKSDSPVGRKITLNFAVADYTVDADLLCDCFSPEHYLCKLTPMHKTAMATANGIRTDGDYTTYHPYRELEERLKAVGYDVLVFIASREEDEGRVTCGNAILSGTEPFTQTGAPT